jgi:hypothetical protein
MGRAGEHVQEEAYNDGPKHENSHRLAEQDHQFQAAIPTVIDGKGHKIGHPFPGPVLVIPFAVGEEGMCFLEVCHTESDSRHVRTPKTPRLPH